MTTTRERLQRIAALDLLERCLEDELEVEADRPHLRIRPARRVTPELEAEAERLKEIVLDVLDPPSPDGPCPNCGSIRFRRPVFGRWSCARCGAVDPGEAVEYLVGPAAWRYG